LKNNKKGLTSKHIKVQVDYALNKKLAKNYKLTFLINVLCLKNLLQFIEFVSSSLVAIC